MKTTMFIIAMMFSFLLVGVYEHQIKFALACLIAMLGWLVVLMYEREKIKA